MKWILCSGDYMFKKFYLGSMTKKEILEKFKPIQGENREARKSEVLSGIAKDLVEGKNIGSTIQLCTDRKKVWTGDGGNRIFGDNIPDDAYFEVFMNYTKEINDVLFLINRLNKNRAHSKGYQAYTNEIIRGLVQPWETAFNSVGIQFNKENPNKTTRSITYLHANNIILASKEGIKDKSVSKSHMLKLMKHMRIFTSASDCLPPQCQSIFRSYAALRGWATVMNEKTITSRDLLTFLSKNADQIEGLIKGKYPRIQYVMWQYISKVAIGCTDIAYEKEYIEKEVRLKYINWK